MTQLTIGIFLAGISFGMMLELSLFVLIVLIPARKTRKDTGKDEKTHDPHQPLLRRDGETEEAFVGRVCEAINDNKLTPNAARKSFGLPPIEKEKKKHETD